ncbi:hypothetical protein ACFQ1A_24470 [Massilia pinisoli]|uniref:hypothetical protein n=1 Tax=Massilia pinisoli TaxID=1772194 RepID=UPI00362CB04F
MNAAAPADARPLARALGAATFGLALGALLLARRGPSAAVPGPQVRRRLPLAPDVDQRDADACASTGAAWPDDAGHEHTARNDPATSALQARRLYQAAAMLAASVLSDSALEHYRGGFENPGMFTPLASAAVVLACALRGAGRDAARAAPTPQLGAPAVRVRSRAPVHARQPARRLHRADDAHPAATVPYATACAVGAAGLGFHAYNVLRRPGGLSWANLFYAAPLGAPAALLLAGVIMLAARAVAAGAPTLAGLPSGRALCGLAAFGLAGTSAEAALLHFRGTFQHPAMWVPVTVPPVTAVMLAGAALPGPPGPRRLTNALLKVCTWLGIVGMGFHARGIARQMGGWRNWSQNVLSGPPLPAPPSFSALALAGRAALALRAAQAGPQREAA